MDKIKVCHVTSVHKNSDLRIFKKECLSLAKANYDVYLVAEGNLSEFKNGVHIIGAGLKPSNRIKRIIEFSKDIINRAIEIDADIYHLHDPELLRFALKLKKLNKKVIFDAHEDVETQILEKEWIPKILRNIISKIYIIYVSKIYKKIDGLISVTDCIVDKLKKYNRNVELITNFPIFYENNNYVPSKVLIPKGINYLFFAGSIDYTWNLDKVSEAINNFDNIYLYFAGPVYKKEYLDLILKKSKKSIYLGILLFDDVMYYYKNSLAGLALNNAKQNISVNGTLGNTKLFEIMQSKVPVICTDLKNWYSIVHGNNTGICVDPNNKESIINAIRYINDNKEEAKIMGENGKNIVKTVYNWENEERKLVVFYDKMIKNNLGIIV